MNVGVVGGHKCLEEEYALAQRTGRLIAQNGWVLICGGAGGVMEAAAKGAKEAGGLTVGILPSHDGREANEYLDVKIPTGLGYARNVLVVRASDVIIAIGGEYGTLSEIAFAFSEGKKVYGIKTWDIKGIERIKSPDEAIDRISRDI